MLIVGIDPGKDGAIAVCNAQVCEATDMPVNSIVEKKGGKRTEKRSLDAPTILETLTRHGRPDMVFIEKQQAYPNQGSVSNYSTGYGYGMLLMALAALKLPFEEVHPKTWQKHFGIKGATKGQSCAIAERLFPGAELRGSRGRALDGRADALLIAEWGRRRMGGTD